MALIHVGDAWKHFREVDAGLRTLALTFMRACARRNRVDGTLVVSLARACKDHEAPRDALYDPTESLMGIVATLDDLGMMCRLFSRVRAPENVARFWRCRVDRWRLVHVVILEVKNQRSWKERLHVDLATACGARGSRASYTFDPSLATCTECCAQQVERGFT